MGLAPGLNEADGAPTPAAIESAIRAKARELFALIARSKASPLSAEYWQSQIMDWAMADERFKVELFRFVDVFPTLRIRSEIDRHLREYFGRADLSTPQAVRLGLAAASQRQLSPLATTLIRREMLGFAQRFIVGRDAADAVPKLKALRRRGIGFTLDVLGEASVGDGEALEYQQRYLSLLDDLQRETTAWTPSSAVDRAAWGPLPRANVSLKITSLYSQIDPLNYRGSVDAVKERLRPLFREAQATGAAVNLDLEQFRYRDLTHTVFKELLEEPEFARYAHAGVVVQAYLRDAEDDLRGLIEWAAAHGRVVTVRLVKGAYWDYETVLAAQEGWPAPVFTHKADTDAMYEHLARLMLEHPQQIRSAFASHNVRSLATVIATAEAMGLRPDAYELQMLHGMAEPIKVAVRRLGLRLREYAPIGELIPGMAYFVRRLLENTANESFLRLAFAEGEEVERLIRAPQPSPDFGKAPQRMPASVPTDPSFPGTFVNQPHADFSLAENRAAFAAALTRVQSGEAAGSLGRHWPLWIGGEAVETTAVLTSVNPAAPQRAVGTTAYAGEAEAELAVAAARAAFPAWSATPARERAAVLFRTAELMRAELFDLAALEVYEAGKTWREADADVAEAIDFLEYYGREIIRLDESGDLLGSGQDLPARPLRPLGVALVVAPWNFPLAILTGMTSGALAAGNTAVVKPAGPAPVIAAQLARLLHAAGAPPGVVNFLPAPGQTIGNALVCHPGVDLIAFTGSKDVGLRIMREAAGSPARSGAKRVIAEMGGKNAIIVDSDADLDVAVLESIVSAFHFQGQKCSAASRIIVLDGAYEEFLTRFVDAARSLVVGDPADPGSRMGPVITAEARGTIESYIERGRREGRAALVTEPPAGGWPEDGYFIGPHIFADVAPGAVIAQEEIFGPVVAVIRARDLDDALAIANGTQYALTGGLISRSPATIARVRRELRVGNLYINRGITGALVERQAFGGFKMSGLGSKAGGPDYLPQFMSAGARIQGAATPAAGGEKPEGAVAAAEEQEGTADLRAARQAADAAFGQARAAAPALRDVSAAARAAALDHAARLVRRNARELQARLLPAAPAQDAVAWSAAEVERAAAALEACAALIARVQTTRRMGYQPGEVNHYFYEPRGLTLVLAAAGRPLTSVCCLAGAALAAGNPVVIRPAGPARESSGYLAGLLAAAGLPQGSVSLLTEETEGLAEYLIAHRDAPLIAVAGPDQFVARVATAGCALAGDRVKRVVCDPDSAPLVGPDATLLREFLEPRVVTENTLRRGFAPAEGLLEGRADGTSRR